MSDPKKEEHGWAFPEEPMIEDDWDDIEDDGLDNHYDDDEFYDDFNIDDVAF